MNNDSINPSLERILDKLDVIEGRVSSVETHLAVYNVELAKHIEGVNLAREEVKLLEKHLDQRSDDFSNRLKPVEAHVNDVRRLFRLLKWLVGAVIALVIAFLDFFKK